MCLKHFFHIVSFFICNTLYFHSEAKHLIGLRLGDFNGFSYKHFINQSFALESTVGRSLYWGYNYDKKFQQFAVENNYEKVTLLDVREKQSLGISVRLLKHFEWKSISRMYWYFGLGLQFNRMENKYFFSYYESFPSRADDGRFNSTTRTQLLYLFGSEALLGFEYSFKEVPINLFLDFSFFIEVLDNPVNLLGQGGIGIRYVFGNN